MIYAKEIAIAAATAVTSPQSDTFKLPGRFLRSVKLIPHSPGFPTACYIRILNAGIQIVPFPGDGVDADLRVSDILEGLELEVNHKIKTPEFEIQSTNGAAGVRYILAVFDLEPIGDPLKEWAEDRE